MLKNNKLSNRSEIMPPESKKLLDQVRETIRLQHYSRKTKKTYVSWIQRFILFHGKKHPQQMGEREIEAFLSHLAVCRPQCGGIYPTKTPSADQCRS